MNIEMLNSLIENCNFVAQGLGILIVLLIIALVFKWAFSFGDYLEKKDKHYKKERLDEIKKVSKETYKNCEDERIDRFVHYCELMSKEKQDNE